jgi:hypothetical protein
LVFLFLLAVVPSIMPVHAQDLAAGKSAAQLFAAGCSACHKSPLGLAKSDGRSIASFLRQHYTSNPQMADSLAAYLAASGGAGRDRGRPGAPAGEQAAVPPSAIPAPRGRGGQVGADSGSPAAEPGEAPPRRRQPGAAPAHAAKPADGDGAAALDIPGRPPADIPGRPPADIPGKPPADIQGKPAPAQSEPLPRKRRLVGSGEARRPRPVVPGPDENKPDDQSAEAPAGAPSSAIISEEHATRGTRDASEHKTGEGSAAPRDDGSAPREPSPATAAHDAGTPQERPDAAPPSGGAGSTAGAPATSAKADDAAKSNTVKSDAVDEDKSGTRSGAAAATRRQKRASARSSTRQAAPVDRSSSDSAN